ncbi:MAG: inositol monophosphatase [Chloroflexi bacterium]|nr:inositol monophosphatase [Chloroflexota bacterium]
MAPSLEYVIDLARKAGEILRQGFTEPHQIEYKGINDIVTEADRQSESCILGQIRGDFPQHTIVSEESGLLSGTDHDAWYIDPLDGTTNFAHGVPIYSVSIAYARNGRLVLGVVYDPMQNECFSAELGKGAWLNGKPIRVSQETDLNKSLLVTGFPASIRTSRVTNLDHFAWFSLHSMAVRRLGSAALDLVYVGAGRMDGYWETSIHSWDIAAGTLIVQEAGGLVTNLEGDPDFFKPPYNLIAATPGIHHFIVEGLNRK